MKRPQPQEAQELKCSQPMLGIGKTGHMRLNVSSGMHVAGVDKLPGSALGKEGAWAEQAVGRMLTLKGTRYPPQRGKVSHTRRYCAHMWKAQPCLVSDVHVI